MATRRGRCKNYKNCPYADDRKVLEVNEAAFVCPNPECKKPLVPIDAPRAKPSLGLPSLGLIAALGAAVVGIAVASYYFFLQTPAAPSTKPAAAWIKELSIER